MIKTCEICGQEFVAKRSDARFCSSTCRQRNRRMMLGYPMMGTFSKPLITVRMMEDNEVAEVIANAHASASDLSRAAMFTPSPLCLKLGRVASKLEKALRDEGL